MCCMTPIKVTDARERCHCYRMHPWACYIGHTTIVAITKTTFIRVFDSFVSIVFIAIRYIKKGDEIFWTYGGVKDIDVAVHGWDFFQTLVTTEFVISAFAFPCQPWPCVQFYVLLNKH